MANNDINILDFWKQQQQLQNVPSPLALPSDKPIVPNVIEENFIKENPVQWDAEEIALGLNKNQPSADVTSKYFKPDSVQPVLVENDPVVKQMKVGKNISSSAANTDETKADAENEVSPEAKPSDKYEKLLAEYEAIRNTPDKNLSALRGGNQIAQAIAAGYGGKIGDNNEVVDKLEGEKKQRLSTILDQLKVMKEMSGKERSSPVGFGQFTNKKGEPLAMLPDGQIINTVTQKIHDPEDGIAKAGTERMIFDKGTGRWIPWTPGVSNYEDTVNNFDYKKYALPKEQRPYDIRQALQRTDSNVLGILDKDIDQFQNEIKEMNRIESELGNIDPLIKAAQTNPSSAQQLGALLAQVFQGGRLTDADVKLYTGRAGIANKVNDWYDNWVNGKIGAETGKDIKETIDLYRQAQQKSLPDRAAKRANNIMGNIHPDLNVNKDVLRQLYYSNDNIATDKIIKVQDKSGKIYNMKESVYNTRYKNDANIKVVE